MSPEQAIQTIARHLAYAAVEDYLIPAGTYGRWREYPEIGERDWQRVEDEAMGSVSMSNPTLGEYDEALRVLAERADDEA